MPFQKKKKKIWLVSSWFAQVLTHLTNIYIYINKVGTFQCRRWTVSPLSFSFSLSILFKAAHLNLQACLLCFSLFLIHNIHTLVLCPVWTELVLVSHRFTLSQHIVFYRFFFLLCFLYIFVMCVWYLIVCAVVLMVMYTFFLLDFIAISCVINEKTVD